jgi:ATP-binding cassette, subfamily B, bacterial
MPEARTGHPLPRLLRYARSRRRTIVLATLCSVLNKVFDLAPPALIGAAIDVLVQRQGSWLAGWGVADVRSQLLVLGVLTVVIFILESLFEYAYALLWRNLAQTLQHELRVDAYRHLQELELGFFEERSTGALLSVLNEDVNQLERFLDGGANEVLQVATTVLVITASFFWLAPEVAWIALLPIPVILWCSFAFQSRIGPRYAAVRERAGELAGQLANNLGGIATIKGFTAEEHEVERIRRASERYRAANRHAIALSSAFAPLIRMIIVVAFTAILCWGGWLALEGRMAVGTFSLLAFLIQRLLWPLTRLGQTFDLYQRAMASTSRVMGLLDQPVHVEAGGRTLPAGEVRGEVRFEDVHFAYARGGEVLHGVTLSVPAGHTVAIVGATGSGKTTLIKLLMRFYDVGSGRITLDGHDVRELDVRSLRAAVGLVSQDVFLFHGSVRENVEYGSFGADESQVAEASRIAEAHGFVERLPHCYDTLVGERGQKLSGGQRQRVSIARAVLKDPPVLVLDEATSSVDNETEAAIQRSLERIAVDRTTIVIAHRLSTVRHADRIYVLEHGRVIEEGRHEQLLARDGLYAALWRVQTGERHAAERFLAAEEELEA